MAALSPLTVTSSSNSVKPYFDEATPEFEYVTAYQAFIKQVVGKQNAKRPQKFTVEQAVLQALPRYRSPDYEVLSAKVSCYSTITAHCLLYSMPSRLVGQRLTIHFYHDQIVGVGTTQAMAVPRLYVHGSAKIHQGCSIDYRHLVESLRCRSRAFLHCDW